MKNGWYQLNGNDSVMENSTRRDVLDDVEHEIAQRDAGREYAKREQ